MNILTFFDLFFILCAIISSGAFVAISAGLSRLRRPQSMRDADTEITIVVAARNEAENIGELLSSLNAQTYSISDFRIIIVDDRSSDGTSDTAKSWNSKGLRIDIIRIDNIPENTSPKKYALHTGISAADTDIILLTDADCKPEADWAASMADGFSRGADIVLGVSPVLSRGGFSGAYSEYESGRTAAMYTSMAALGMPYMAVGRSWGFRRNLYHESGGLPRLYNVLGGDDDLLFQLMIQSRPAASVIAVPEARCPTASGKNFTELIRQKLRHYGVSRHYTFRIIVLLFIFTFTEAAALLVAPVYFSLFRGVSPYLCVAAAYMLSVYNTGFLLPLLTSSGPSAHGLPGRLRIALLELFHVVFSVSTGLISFIVKPRW